MKSLLKKSHLLQMRGLKPLLLWTANKQPSVASFTDAWIETEMNANEIIDRMVASFTDAWIETDPGRYLFFWKYVASFTDAWIETRYLSNIAL